MRKSTLSYYRDERARLTERWSDVQQEAAGCRSRLVELEREEQLLSQLLAALDAHVPGEAVTAVQEFPRLSSGRGAA